MFDQMCQPAAFEFLTTEAIDDQKVRALVDGSRHAGTRLHQFFDIEPSARGVGGGILEQIEFLAGMQQ